MLDKHDQDHLKLRDVEWRQVEYIIQLTRPFAMWTESLSSSSGPTAFVVFNAYNQVLGLLEAAMKKTRRKEAAWKQDIHTGLQHAYEKLQKYYSQTKGDLGDFYGHAILLHPQMKKQFFKQEEWAGGWDDRYWTSLTELFIENYNNDGPAGRLRHEVGRNSMADMSGIDYLLGMTYEGQSSSDDDSGNENTLSESLAAELRRWRDYGECKFC